MKQVDVAIIGGGLAGSLAAAMLGRAGISTAVFDVHKTYPEDFRVEKIDERTLGILQKTGLSDDILRVGTLYNELWLFRGGKLIDKKPCHQYGIAYADLVNKARSLIPSNVEFVFGRVRELAANADRQSIVSNGQEWQSRVMVLATGLNCDTTRQQVGIRREEVSKCHSVTIGFDLESRGKFAFPALTCIGNPQNRISYMTIFPMRGTMRVNIFLYRDIRDPWLEAMRRAPKELMLRAMPELEQALGEFDVTSEVLIRPMDLIQTKGYERAGVVLVGDSFATSCPAAGRGSGKVCMDVQRLCNVYIPQWLQTDGMPTGKIAAFYNDHDKVANDQESTHLAFYLRNLTLDHGWPWRIRRAGWFALQSFQGFRRIAA